ncbi:glycosyltransferase [Mesorhizobium sp. M0293]|uniref:glycosyltransferase n=1 Tax=unclassified Mesorhizobium TaxID=325217 RepID=UPI0033378BA4
MRVIHIAQSIAGGVGTYLDEIAACQLKSEGTEDIFFVVPEGSAEYLPFVSPKQTITFPSLGRTPLGLLVFGAVALKAIKTLDPAIVHLHSSFAGAVVRPMLALRPARPRIVYCPHGWAFGMEVGAVKKQFYCLCERILAALTDVIIVNSDAEHTLGQRYHIPASKMRTIKNGIAPGYGAKPKVWPRDEGCLDLIFIGRHDRQKGLDILLREIGHAGCENIRLHVVGKPVLGGSLPVPQIPKNVKFYGWLSRADIFEMLPRMDALVMPSRWEAFGLTAIEAMRSGIPVIASNRGALPEVVRHGLDGLIVDINRPGELGRVLAGLDRAELKKFGKVARARFRAEFTSDRMNHLIETLYRWVLATSRQPVAAAAIPARRSALRRRGTFPRERA